MLRQRMAITAKSSKMGPIKKIKKNHQVFGVEQIYGPPR